MVHGVERPGLELICFLCDNLFWICKRDYRGHKYCSDICRQIGKLVSKKNAQHKYSKSNKSKKAHAKRQSKYRQHQKFNGSPIHSFSDQINKVTDQSSIKKKITIFQSTQHRLVAHKHCLVCGIRLVTIVRNNERATVEKNRVDRFRPSKSSSD